MITNYELCAKTQIWLSLQRLQLTALNSLDIAQLSVKPQKNFIT